MHNCLDKELHKGWNFKYLSYYSHKYDFYGYVSFIGIFYLLAELLKFWACQCFETRRFNKSLLLEIRRSGNTGSISQHDTSQMDLSSSCPLQKEDGLCLPQSPPLLIASPTLSIRVSFHSVSLMLPFLSVLLHLCM